MESLNKMTYENFFLNAFPIFDLRMSLAKIILCGHFIFECIIAFNI